MPGPIIGGLIFAGKTAYNVWKLWKNLHPDDDAPFEGQYVSHPWGNYVFRNGDWVKVDGPNG